MKPEVNPSQIPAQKMQLPKTSSLVRENKSNTLKKAKQEAQGKFPSAKEG